MGLEMAAEAGAGPGSLEDRPGVLLIGSPNVGKRSLLSRLLSTEFPEMSDLSSGILCQGWTIETKYYSADISIWTTNLDKGFSFRTLPFSKHLVALVMVFDLNDESSFITLRDCVASIDIKRFDILLCIGNKADLVPGHYAHVEYRRYLQKHGESSGDPHPEYLDYGIHESEACSLLGDEEPSLEVRKRCSEWCLQYNIEFIETCASNAVFDKCLSVHGDIQGVERLYGALSAHMWPGMILKSGNMMSTSYQIKKEELTDDESDYEIEYEVLSRGSEEPWEDYAGHSDISFSEPPDVNKAQTRDNQDLNHEILVVDDDGAKNLASTSKVTVGDHDQKDKDGPSDLVSTLEVEAREESGVDVANTNEYGVDLAGDYGDMERLMCDISGIRDNLRLMPDFQRREMAAKLAIKMAEMFGDDNTDEEDAS